MTSNTEYRIAPISAADAAALRERGGEVYVADAMPGYPCRQCLRDAEIGDNLLLVSHDPFDSNSPYRSASPIFLHEADCRREDDEVGPSPEALPIQLTRRQLSVRSFDSNEMMLDAAVIDGQELDETIRRFFDDDSADHLHIHNATRGCWAAAVHRASLTR